MSALLQLIVAARRRGLGGRSAMLGSPADDALLGRIFFRLSALRVGRAAARN